MGNRKTIIIGIVIVAGAIGWYLFRPELIFINQRVSEDFPAAPSGNLSASQPSTTKELSRGEFHGVAHETRGFATVYELEGGKRLLRLTDFETSNGPDVQVVLVAAQDASDNETVTRAGFLRVGALKGNIGDQNYELPSDVDLDQYRAVTIWCRRFGVNFATAPLMETRGQG